MDLLKPTWTVSYHEDFGLPAVETLKGVSREEATVEVRRIRDAGVVQKIIAEVLDEQGKRIAKHQWLRVGSHYAHSQHY